MLISELCSRLPGEILSRRIVKENAGLPEMIMFLLQPGALRSSILYLTDARSAAAFLPECSAPGGSTVLCAGALPSTVAYQVNINLICVDCALPELHNAAAEFLCEQQRSISLEAERLQKRFATILEDSYATDLQVEAICASFPKRLKSSYCVICVEMKEHRNSEDRNARLRTALAELFTEDNLTTYDKDIIIIHSYDGFTHPPKLPLEELSRLLQQYDACAGVSNGIRKPGRLRTMYTLAKKTLESGKIIWGAERNVYFYDDTMIFSIISLAAAGYEERFDTDDIIPLFSPIVLNIIKHDPDGKRELLETLFQYIINGRSASKTAEAMHMHRNTVQNRISLIEEITGEQLSKDGMLQAKLLLTYYAIQYYTKVRSKKLVLSPLEEGKEPVARQFLKD